MSICCSFMLLYCSTSSCVKYFYYILKLYRVIPRTLPFYVIKAFIQLQLNITSQHKGIPYTENLTLKAPRSCTVQVSMASLPTGAVTFIIGSLKFGSERSREKENTEWRSAWRIGSEGKAKALVRAYIECANPRPLCSYGHVNVLLRHRENGGPIHFSLRFMSAPPPP